MLPTVRPSDIDDLVLSPNAWDSQKFGSQTIVKGTEEMTTAVAKGYEGVPSGLGHGTAAYLSGVVQMYREIQRLFVKRQCCFFFQFICSKHFGASCHFLANFAHLSFF